jgi:hypothetical protein
MSNSTIKATSKNDKIKKIVLVGTGITATGIAAYFGWQYYKKSQEGKSKKPTNFSPMQDPIPEYKPTNTSNNNGNNNSSYSPPFTPPYQGNSNSKPNNSNSGNSNSNIADAINTVYNSIPKTKKDFPLKRGSKGLKVRELQDALIATHGASILPRYGADGDFGSELAAALKKLKYPSIVNESLFYVITSSSGKGNTYNANSGSTNNHNSMARQFLLALNVHNFNKTVELLKVLKSKVDYTTVSTEFKNYRVNGGVRQTLVNACLNAFVDAKQKQTIRLEFLRMGLKYNGTQWSLDGLGNGQIMTTRATQIWLDGFTSMPVPCRMVLGKAISARLDYTLFEKDGKHFLVLTKDVQAVK